MPVGQYEAAKILGYNKVQTFFRIILPQVIKRILPSITNEVITLVKDTSLAFCCGSCGDVYHCQADRKCTDNNDAICDRCDILLCVQPDRGCCDAEG